MQSVWGWPASTLPAPALMAVHTAGERVARRGQRVWIQVPHFPRLTGQPVLASQPLSRWYGNSHCLCINMPRILIWYIYHGPSVLTFDFSSFEKKKSCLVGRPWNHPLILVTQGQVKQNPSFFIPHTVRVKGHTPWHNPPREKVNVERQPDQGASVKVYLLTAIKSWAR
jgi:hypothetical protein